MHFPKSEYMKLITRTDVKKRLNAKEQVSYDYYKSDIYYSKVIDQVQQDNKYQWNWSAAFCQGAWLIYRGMFLYSLLYSFLYTLLTTMLAIVGMFFIIPYLSADYDENNIVALFVGILIFLSLAVYFVSFFILGKFGNKIYFYFLDNKISKGWNLVPRKNTHPWVAFSAYVFTWLLLFIIPYYLYKKVIFNRDLNKAKLLAETTS